MSDGYTIEQVSAIVNCVEVQMTGSRVICPQSVHAASDHDFLVRVENLNAAYQDLVAKDFHGGASMDDNDAIKPGVKFVSLKRNDLNLIVTDDAKFFADFMLATRVATQLGLTYRGHRIALFQAILYGKG